MFVHLRLPGTIVVPRYRDRLSGLEGLCIVLRRLVYPKRWVGLSQEFARHISALSRIFTYMMHLILQQVKGSIMFSKTLSREKLLECHKAFVSKGVPLQLRIWSIIDVKKVHNCRPTHDQRAQYSGHTKYHCFKYQTLQTPDGLSLACWNVDGLICF